jgi:outer membrane protease
MINTILLCYLSQLYNYNTILKISNALNNTDIETHVIRNLRQRKKFKLKIMLCPKFSRIRMSENKIWKASVIFTLIKIKKGELMQRCIPGGVMQEHDIYIYI